MNKLLRQLIYLNNLFEHANFFTNNTIFEIILIIFSMLFFGLNQDLSVPFRYYPNGI